MLMWHAGSIRGQNIQNTKSTFVMLHNTQSIVANDQSIVANDHGKESLIPTTLVIAICDYAVNSKPVSQHSRQPYALSLPRCVSQA